MSPPHVAPPGPGGVGAARLELYWIPLGAGASVVRVSGRAYERIVAAVHRRTTAALFHSALVVTRGRERWIIEMAPIPDAFGVERRGVVCEGPVGTRWARHLRVFRYEVRRWCGGELPDLRYAVGSPVRVSEDGGVVTRVLDLVPFVPTAVWGRDELHTGEMWNSNSVTSWVLAKAGVLGSAGLPPSGGRAPGWDAGVRVASRDRVLTRPGGG